MNKILFLILLTTTIANGQTTKIISGIVKEQSSLERLPGVNVYVPKTNLGTVTNNYGFFSISLPDTSSFLMASFVGYKPTIEKLEGNQNLNISIELIPENELDEVVISAEKQNDRISDSPQMSTIDLPVDQIKKIPALLGEKDVFKVLQLMPGVQSGSEGQTGLYVRGGGPDQNLVILDDAIVYNANHLFGFLSVFNGDALKSVELVKGGFPARYGGRLSSVIELQMKDGNKEKLHGEGGIGLIASRLMLEGPIKKGKSSFVISGRRIYADLIARPIIKKQNEGEAVGGYYFYDLNSKLNFELGKKDNLYLSGYFGKDRFYAHEKGESIKSDAKLEWGNATATARWNHIFNQKLFANTSLIFSNFLFQIVESSTFYNDKGKVISDFSLNYNSKVRDFAIKSDFDFYPNPKNSMRFGFQVIQHKFNPSAITVKGTNSGNIKLNSKPLYSLESGIYVEDLIKPNSKTRINLGFRLSNFISNSKSYINPEPRISASYKIGQNLALKGSYANMNQYIHLLSNTGLGLPTDLWVPTTDLVKPQKSQQVALGIAKDFDKNNLTLTVEAYYKKMRDIITYKEGASFLAIEGSDPSAYNWQNNITSGGGYSTGLEFMLQKKVGKFSGWAGYTLSWTKWKFAELNFGKEFFPKYDRRHDISLVGIYEINKRLTLSATWVYGTGNALTMPQGSYESRNYNPEFHPNFFTATYYGEKNSWRGEAYHRFDIGLQIIRPHKNWEGMWEFSIYNLYSRKNPFFYNLEYVPSKIDGISGRTALMRYSIFPIIPSISYNFKF